MANEIHNILTLKSPDIEQVFAFIKSERKLFDFEKVIPLPHDVTPRDVITNDDWTHGKLNADWCTRNWGTTRNAYDEEISGNMIQFHTHWTPPIAVVRALSKIFPDVEMKITAYDSEDYGCTGGTLIFKGGKMIFYNVYDLPFETLYGTHDRIDREFIPPRFPDLGEYVDNKFKDDFDDDKPF